MDTGAWAKPWVIVACVMTAGVPAAARPTSAHAVRAFRLSSGSYEASFQPGQASIAIRRIGARDGRALCWTPGGNPTALPFLDPKHLVSVDLAQGPAGHTALLKGRLEWARYTVGIAVTKGTPGLFRTWVEIDVVQPAGARRALSLAGAELAYQDSHGGRPDPQAVFYFENPVSFPIKLWEWRRDMNQFVHFGDRGILKSTLLYYADFTSMDRYFADSGTAMFRSVTGWETHEDIVQQPQGAYGTAPGPAFQFGLRIPAPAADLTPGRRYRISAAILSLEPEAPGTATAADPARRFISAYRRVFEAAPKPEITFRRWDLLAGQLMAELGRRRDPNWVYWTLATPHFNQLAFLDYTARFAPGSKPRMVDMSTRQLRPCFEPNYTNDFGSRGIYGWYRNRETATKADFWQGYLWPIYILNEYAMRTGNAEMRRISMASLPVLLDVGRRLDYTYTVFVNLNSAQRVESGYDYDYGAAGIYAALMLQYYKMTGEARYLDESRRAAQQLNTFGYGVGFEMQVPALSAVTLLRLYRITGDRQYLNGVYPQLAVILKHTWLFNPHYGRFAGRDLFGLTSCRSNLCYANGAEEGTIMRLLRTLLEEGRGRIDPACLGLVADVLKWKVHGWADALPALHMDKSVLFLGQPENWDPIKPDSVVPVEPFGYNLDGRKLGFLNECIYGCNLVAEAALVQFHPLPRGGLFYTQGPARILAGRSGVVRVRGLSARLHTTAGLKGSGYVLCTAAGKRVAPARHGRKTEWAWYSLAPGTDYLLARAIRPPSAQLTAAPPL